MALSRERRAVHCSDALLEAKHNYSKCWGSSLGDGDGDLILGVKWLSTLDGYWKTKASCYSSFGRLRHRLGSSEGAVWVVCGRLDACLRTVCFRKSRRFKRKAEQM